MERYTSPIFDRKLKRLSRKNKDVFSILDTKWELFIRNREHPSLRLHKLSGTLHNRWSISLSRDLRVIFQYVNEGILLVDIGTHGEVYEK